MKVINPKIHGVLDYGLAALFLLLPPLLGFSAPAAIASYIVGVLYIIGSLVTGYPLGAFKVWAFAAHGVAESMMAVAWIVFPWLFQFSQDDVARNFFVIAGVALLAVVALTDYQGPGTKAAMTEESMKGGGYD